ncbi:MAG: TIGR01777 family oxidoreductase [Arcobacteraceae bacterium]
MKKMIIAGASGFVGSTLTHTFTQLGYLVIPTSREDLKDISKLTSKIDGADVVINLAGANIINRWSQSYKKLLYNSRIDTTKALVEAFTLAKIKPKTFISTSAVGIYKNDAIYDETTTNYADDFLGKLCQDWEKEALKAQALDIRVSIFRFGIVMGNGGALAKMLTPFKFGVGGTIGDGSQSFSFIHIDDLMNAYKFVIDNDTLSGKFNLTAPKPTTNYGLTKALGATLHRPTIFPIPQFVLNLILSEGAKVLTDGQKAVPNHLLESGFSFEYETIEDTIEDLV